MMLKSYCFFAVLICILATPALSQCSSKQECDKNCQRKKEEAVMDEVMQVCRWKLPSIDSDSHLHAVSKLRPRNFAEMQPYLLAYGAIISSVSPFASCYQLLKLNPHIKVSTAEMLKLSFAILPQQMMLKDMQMTIATPIKKKLNPWAAFAAIGVLQGVVYGHSNVHFANALHIGSKPPSLAGVFKGVGFAGARDLISQGFPFVFAPVLEKSILDRVVPSKKHSFLTGVKHWLSVFALSVFGTYASQGFHNSQITMQANTDLGYAGAVKKLFAMNGFAALYKGAEARVGLLLVVAFLNELLLKKAWQGVEVKAEAEQPEKHAEPETPHLKDSESKSGIKLRPRSVAEMQPYLLAYGAIISSVSPFASCYQLCKLNPQVKTTTAEMLKLSLAILPQQMILKDMQMTIATPIKKKLNPWAAFAAIGVLQGVVYGHSNVHFANALHIGSKPSLAGVFKGVGFAACRDVVSQGFPFVFAPVLEKSILDRVVPSKNNALVTGVKHWLSVFALSVFGTYASQGFHNSQITMQANTDLGYAGAVKKLFAMNGFAALYKGAEARVGLLLVVAFLNELLLKKAWQGVPIPHGEEDEHVCHMPALAKSAVLDKDMTCGNPLITSKQINTQMLRRNSLGAAGPATVPQAA